MLGEEMYHFVICPKKVVFLLFRLFIDGFIICLLSTALFVNTLVYIVMFVI